MKFLSRIGVLLALLLSPAVMATAQTPEAVTGDPSSFASGMNQPATFFDDRGNPVFEVMVTGVELDWQDYDEFSAPERGSMYVKVDFSFTNLSDRAEIVSPYTIMLIDNMGLATTQGYFADAPDLMIEDVSLDPGGTVEGSLVFSMYMDLEPMMIVWQPDYNLYVFIHIGE